MANSKDTGDGHVGEASTGREPQSLGRAPPMLGKLGAICEGWMGSAQRRGLQRGLREVGGIKGRRHHQMVARQEGRGQGLGSEAAGLSHPHGP